MSLDEAELRKMQYQIRLLGEALDSKLHPIPVLVLGLNWGEAELNHAEDIFEKYQAQVDLNQSEVNWTAFEMELREAFSIGYQTVKQIVLAFYRNGQWPDVCIGYALAKTSIELHEIVFDFKKDEAQLRLWVARMLARLHLDFDVEPEGGPDFIVRQNGEKIGLELKALTGRAIPAWLTEIREQMASFAKRHELSRVILVVPDRGGVQVLDAAKMDACSIFDLAARLNQRR